MDERMIYCLPDVFSGKAGISEEKPEKLHLKKHQMEF